MPVKHAQYVIVEPYQPHVFTVWSSYTRPAAGLVPGVGHAHDTL